MVTLLYIKKWLALDFRELDRIQPDRPLASRMALALPFLFGGGYVPVAAARNAVVADSADAGAAAEVRGAGGAIGAVVAVYAPGGVLGVAHHDDDVIAGIWSDGDE